MQRTRVTCTEPEDVALATACVGSLAACAEMRAAFGTVLRPLASLLRLNWTHCDLPEGESLPQQRLDVLVVVPPTQTWSRARHRATTCHQALRSKQWPWGLPQAAGSDRAKIEEGNTELRRGLRLLHAALADNERLTLAFVAPEDRGALDDTHPSSIWQLKELRRWSRIHECRRAALNQCELGQPQQRHRWAFSCIPGPPAHHPRTHC